MVRVIVLGASGNIGEATLHALVVRHPELEIYAGVRDPSRLPSMPGVTAVHANMGDKAELSGILQAYERVFIVSPGSVERVELAAAALQACKAANVKFVLLSSGTLVGTDTIFGKQFKTLEEHAKDLGLLCTFVRLGIFMENYFENANSIKAQDTIYDPRDPTQPFTPVVVGDVGKACADILANPALHIGKAYELVSPASTLNEAVALFSKILGKEIRHVRVPYAAAKNGMIGSGLPELLADGLIEIFQYVDKGSPNTNVPDTGSIERITGEKATTTEEWLQTHKAAFE